MIQICYTSRAVRPLGSPELIALLAKSRTSNQSIGVTGLLIYERGVFIQILEGYTDTVKALLAKITLDPRHKDVELTFEQPIEAPSFGDWSMGFFHIDRPTMFCLPGFNKTFGNGLTDPSFWRDADRVRALLSRFRRGEWQVQVQAA